MALTYRRDIDGLRSLAIVPVVIYHSGLPGLSGGFLGVDVFFVISGFLITSILVAEVNKGQFSLVNFYERRARRILPALFAVIVACLVAGWFLLLPTEFAELGEAIFATALFVSNIYFMVTLDYFATAADFVPLLHTWSLAVEEQFYLFFPPLVAFVLGRYGLRAMIWTVIVLSAVSLAAAIYMVAEQPIWAFYLILFRAWELGLGALLALIPLRPVASRALRETVGVAALLAVLVPMVVYTSATPFPGLAAVPPVVGAALLIWVGAVGGSTVSRIMSLPLLVGIGLISYSLYLWHWPVMAFTRIVTGAAHLPFGLALATIAASVILAYLSYALVEQPFRKAPPKGRYGRRGIFVMSGGVMAISITAGLGLRVVDGIPTRLPAEAQALAEARFDRNPDRPRCFNKVPDEGLCQIGAAGDDGAADFFFWGDSHGDALAPGIDLAAEAAGQTGLYAGFVACPPIRDAVRVPAVVGCADNRAEIVGFLEAREDMGLVILASRWPLSVEGSRYGREGGDGVDLRWIGSDPPETTNNPALVEAGLRRVVEQITATGRQVVLLGSVPEVGYNVPGRLARANWLDTAAPPPLSREAFDARAGASEAILADIASGSDQVMYLPLSEALCDETVCQVQSPEGAPLYFDDNHLSYLAATTRMVPTLSTIWAE